jgi:hypothetical protein
VLEGAHVSDDYGFERRRPGELTPNYLGRVLDDYLGLHDMAKRARQGHFDDFFAPPEVADGLEILRLHNELRKHARNMQASGQKERMRKVLEVDQAVVGGEFDATKEESDRWAASKDGQETMRLLLQQDD